MLTRLSRTSLLLIGCVAGLLGLAVVAYEAQCAPAHLCIVAVFLALLSLAGREALRSQEARKVSATREKAVRMHEENEKKVRMLFDTANDAIFVHPISGDADVGRFSEVNRRACEMLGYTREQLLEKTPFEITAFLDTATGKNIARTILAQHRHEFEVELRTASGGRVPVEVSARLFHWDGNLAVLSMARDVSSRYRAERALSNSRQFLRNVLDAISAHVAVVNRSGVVVEVNRAWEMFAHENGGTDRICSVGSDYLDTCRRSAAFCGDAGRALAGIQGVLDGGPSFYLEYGCHSPREQRWYQMRVHPFRSEMGGNGAIIIHEEITEAKRAEEVIRESETRLREALRLGKMGHFEYNVKQDLFGWSPEACQLIQYAGELGWQSAQSAIRLFFPDQALDLLQSLRECVHTRKAVSYHCRAVLADGHLRHFSGMMRPVMHGTGDVEKVIGVIQDTTNQKETEMALVRAKLAAEAADRAKSAFLATMSHEIRTPMNALLGYAELLSTTALNREQAENLEVIRNSGELLLELINEILDYTKIESGGLMLSSYPVEMNGLCESVISLMGMKARMQGLEIRLEKPATLPAVVGDELRLKQVLINLLGNAVKFTQVGHVTLKVSVIQVDDQNVRLRFDVEDTGIGIAPEKLKRLFQPFSQADATVARDYGGTGLGLAISRKLVRLMGGDIWVESTLGEGSTFSFEIPGRRADMAASSPSGTTTQGLQVGLTMGGGKQPRILIVEDNALNLRLTQQFLATCMLNSKPVRSSAEAVQVLKLERFDLILMDLRMPGEDGLSLTRRIREGEAGEANRAVYIIAVTALASQGDREACFEAGMDDYLSKPLQLTRLCKALETAFTRIAEREAQGAK